MELAVPAQIILFVPRQATQFCPPVKSWARETTNKRAKIGKAFFILIKTILSRVSLEGFNSLAMLVITIDINFMY